MDIETVSMTLIAHAGEARRLAFEALAKERSYFVPSGTNRFIN